MSQSQQLVSATNLALSGDFACLGSALVGGATLVGGRLTCTDVTTDRLIVAEEITLNPGTALSVSSVNATSELSARTLLATDSVQSSVLTLTGSEDYPASITQNGTTSVNTLKNTIIEGDLTVTGNLNLNADAAAQTITIESGDQLLMEGTAVIVQDSANTSTQNQLVATTFCGPIVQNANNGVDANTCLLRNVTTENLTLPTGNTLAMNGNVVASSSTITPQNMACLQGSTQVIGPAISGLQTLTGRMKRINNSTGIDVPSDVTSLPAPWNVYGNSYCSGIVTAATDVVVGSGSRSLGTSLGTIDTSLASLTNKTTNQTRANAFTGFNKTTPTATVDVGGTLAVSGASSLASTLSVTGTSVFTGAMSANGGLTASTLKYGTTDVATRFTGLDSSFSAIDLRTGVLTRSGTNVGVNKPVPTVALDVVGSGAFSVGLIVAGGSTNIGGILQVTQSASFGDTVSAVGNVSSLATITAPTMTVNGRNVGTSLTSIDSSLAALDGNLQPTMSTVSALVNIAASASATTVSGAVTVDASISTDDFSAPFTTGNTKAQLTLAHSARTDGKGVSRLLFAKPGGGDSASIASLDRTDQFPCYNYWGTADTDRSAMVLAVGDDPNSTTGDGIIIASSGNTVIDAGVYGSKTAFPSTTNRTSSSNVLLQPYGGSVCVGKTAPTAGVLVDVAGTLAATTISANGTNVGATITSQNTRLTALESKTQNATATTGSTSLAGTLAVASGITIGGQAVMTQPQILAITDPMTASTTCLTNWYNDATFQTLWSIPNTTIPPSTTTTVVNILLPPYQQENIELVIPLFASFTTSSSVAGKGVTMILGTATAGTDNAAVATGITSSLASTVTVTVNNPVTSGIVRRYLGTVKIVLFFGTPITTETNIAVRLNLPYTVSTNSDFQGTIIPGPILTDVSYTNSASINYTISGPNLPSTLVGASATQVQKSTVHAQRSVVAQRGNFRTLCTPNIAGFRLDGTVSSKQYVYTPIFCSSAALSPVDTDDVLMIFPGWRLELFDAVNYVTLLGSIDNTNGSGPRTFLSADLGGNNRVASLKAYFFGNEVTLPYIS